MSCYLHAGWDFARIGHFHAEITDTGGTVTASAATGLYCNVTMAGASNLTGLDVTAYTDLAAWLKGVLDAGLNGTFTVTFSASTGQYTISSTEAFTGANLNTLAQQILGASSATITSTTSKTFPNRAYHSVITASGAMSGVHEYETNAMASDGEADDGTPSGMVASSLARYHDFNLAVEPVAMVRKRDAVSTAPWTYEHLWQHCRNINPFMISENEDTVHMLRATGAAFDPTPMTDDNSAYWVLNFQTRMLAGANR